MPRDLFGDVTRPSISIGNRKWYTLPLSLFSHSAIVILLIAVPIVAPAVMPAVFADNEPVWIKAAPPTPLALPRTKPPTHNAAPPTASGPPIEAPSGIAPETSRPAVGWEDSDPTLGVIDGNFDTSAVASPPPAPAVAPQPIRVGDTLRAPLKVRDVKPVYPPIAQSARVQGVVIIEATISPDGQVTTARILRSVPLLDQAAIDAVRQWQFTPTLLNGVPVPVIMTITIHFTLQ
jgi:protein TonB